MSKRNICDVHKDIVNECNSIIKDINRCSKNDSQEELYNLIDNIRWQLDNYVVSYAVEALEYGQSMENRMRDYKDAIEGLGFVRDS